MEVYWHVGLRWDEGAGGGCASTEAAAAAGSGLQGICAQVSGTQMGL